MLKSRPIRNQSHPRPTALAAVLPPAMARQIERYRLDLLPLLAAAMLAISCTTMPSSLEPQAQGGGDEAAQLLAASVEAHGGDVYEELDNVAVAYDGRWGKLIQRIQPVVTDPGYRKTSEERLLIDEGRMVQRFSGPAGVKTVLRSDDGVTVTYFPAGDGENGGDRSAMSRPGTAEEEAASALVADAYEMFLAGPSFLRQRARDLQLLPPEREDGRIYDRVQMRVEPGFGLSPVDTLVAWLDRDSRLLYRVLFTIDGTESTRGAAVDVTFHDHRRVGDHLWPTRFVERVRAPLKIFAHEWFVTGLDLDRPETTALMPEDLLRLDRRPAAPLPARAD